jgi:phage virion morphogenesis protein
MMSGIRLLLDERPLLAMLGQLQRAAEDPRRAYDAIGAYLVTATQRRFERETGPDGRRWQKLSPRTANRRIGRSRRGYDHILRVRNRLYQSIVYEAADNQVAVGTNLVYAAIQQLGGSVIIPERDQDIHLSTGKGRRRFVRASAKRMETRRVHIGAHTITIPARPYLGIDQEDEAQIQAIVEDFFREEAGEP